MAVASASVSRQHADGPTGNKGRASTLTQTLSDLIQMDLCLYFAVRKGGGVSIQTEKTLNPLSF